MTKTECRTKPEIRMSSALVHLVVFSRSPLFRSPTYLRPTDRHWAIKCRLGPGNGAHSRIPGSPEFGRWACPDAAGSAARRLIPLVPNRSRADAGVSVWQHPIECARTCLHE